MKVLVVTVLSTVLSAIVISNAYAEKKQFYPTVVYLLNSNRGLSVIYLQAFVMLWFFCKFLKTLFFGTLRAAEVEHLVESSWFAILETFILLAAFHQELSLGFVTMVTILFISKSFHWLAIDRVDYMERSPVITWLFHLRTVCLFSLLLLLDYLFVSHSWTTLHSRGPSVDIVFGLEYAIMFLSAFSSVLHYILHTIDRQSEDPWENKTIYIRIIDIILGFFKLALYVGYMTFMLYVLFIPLHIARRVYITAKNFQKSIHDVIASQQAIRHLNTLYPDATIEELEAVNNVCIICREEMVSRCKKLPCNHIFHTACLQSWFQRQQTCPTCRMDILNQNLVNQLTQGAQGGQGQGVQGAQRHQQQPPRQQQQQAFQRPPNNGFPPPMMFPNAPMMPLAMMPQMPPMMPQMPPPMMPQMPPPMMPPPPQQQHQPDAPGGDGRPAQPEARHDDTNGGGAAAASPTTGPPLPHLNHPSLFLSPSIPMGFMPQGFAVPGPISGDALQALSLEQLQQLEGMERANVEARLSLLRDVQKLLDSAVLRLNQYTTVMAAVSPPAGPGFQGFPHLPFIPPQQHNLTTAETLGPNHNVIPTQNSNSAQLPDTQGRLFQSHSDSRTQESAEPSLAMSKSELEDRFTEATKEDVEKGQGEDFIKVGVGDNSTAHLDMMEIRQRRLERFHSAPVSTDSSASAMESSVSKSRTADDDSQLVEKNEALVN